MEYILKIIVYLILGATIINASWLDYKIWQADKKNGWILSLLFGTYGLGIIAMIYMTSIMFR